MLQAGATPLYGAALFKSLVFYFPFLINKYYKINWLAINLIFGMINAIMSKYKIASSMELKS